MSIHVPRVLGLSILLASTCFAAAPVPGETFERAPARPVDTARDRNLYVVGYSHLDTQWRWTYPQVIRQFIGNTLKDNFALLEKYPNYVFNFSGSRRYEMMEEYYPAEFARLKDLVAAGRWFPAGSSVDENDSVVPSAESTLRHVLYGNAYFRRHFGVASEEFMLPDCFGFPYSLPTMLAHAGVKGFSTQKLTWGSAAGIPFKVGVWIGPDGNSVVAALDPGAYTGRVRTDLSASESWLKRINATGAQSGAFVDYHYFGTGDQGGAPDEESVRWVEQSIAGKGPVRVIPAKADQLFLDLSPEQRAKLPQYRGELLLTQHSAGSITSAAYMKRWNRKNELLADAAERAAVTADWLGAARYPAAKLYRAWDLVLGSQMHDMLPGTSVPKAYEFCWNDEILAANQYAAVLEHSVGGIAAGLDTRAQGVALVVYNPLGFAREDVVEAAVTFPAGAPAHVRVRAPDGHDLPVQVLRRDGNTLHVAFVAGLAPVSFATFDVTGADTAAASDGTLKISASALENARYRVAVDAQGDIASVHDKVANRELLAGPSRLAFQFERPREYPAWNMDWEDRQKPPRGFVSGPAQVRIVESGPVRVALEITRETDGSRFVQTVRLARGGAGDRVEVATRIDWQTRESSLKAVFPLTVSNPMATYDSQVGTLDRGNNEPKKYEVPQHQWFNLDAPDQSYGVAVLNDSKFGSDKPDDATLRLTLLYTPATRDRYQDQATQDFGRHEILYAITGHAGDWRRGQVPQSAARLNQPMLAFTTPSHPGALGRGVSLFQVTAENVLLQAVKKAEQGDEIVVRFRELSGTAAKGVRLRAAGAIAAAREVDGQERPLAGATIDHGELVFDLQGYGLRAFALKLDPAKSLVTPTASQPVPLTFTDDVVSTNAKRTDGSFDSAGRALPAEQLPATIVSEGVEFQMGPTQDGRANALTARGQRIALPAGFDRVYLLAAADGDTTGVFRIDDRSTELRVQDWTGYIGQWDNRLWAGTVREIAFSWFNPLAGLAPGFSKPATVAWYASHRHSAQGDDHYQYSYLFKYALEVPAGAKTLTLPDNPRIRVLAISVARDDHAQAKAATPLFDTMRDHLPEAPRVSPAGGTFDDSLAVTLQPPLYWRQGGLRYTLDGSKPTAASPVYSGPVTVHHDVVVSAAEFDAAGRSGPVASATLRITDRTAPRLLEACGTSTSPLVRLTFSEPVDPSTAEVAANYAVSGAEVRAAKLMADGHTVMLTLAAPVAGPGDVTVRAVLDRAPTPNRLAEQTLKLQVVRPVLVREGAVAGGSEEVALPAGFAKRGRSWTINGFVRTEQPVANRTMLFGFGRLDVKGRDGVGRYFGNFANGLHFWMGRPRIELESNVELKPGVWQMLTATYDGRTLRMYVDGQDVGAIDTELGNDEDMLRLAPLDPWDNERKFKGQIQQVSAWDGVLSVAAIEVLKAAGPQR
ncbi:glycoside hydrolase family 38 C-terminal domain-containing protein [Opitutus sp. ER46]|uniref:glycoside hydrolase family 38 N-terminal domain-containing protein n=1 Tax=Opitutus sp. ER46 TaxID=2161864 RepID=UPI000D31B9BD|nr:glycoside hydrolase family 38 C-terminal domain-containing protein [Opitutus sp. ER46]PTX99076.1 alpha-mannosidase [Opitutus sp. ER46]